MCLQITTSAITLTPEENTIKENMIKFEELNDEIMSLNSQISALDVEIDLLNSTITANNKSVEDIKSKISFNE